MNGDKYNEGLDDKFGDEFGGELPDFTDPKFQPIAKAMHADLYDAVRDFALAESADAAHKLFELTDMEPKDWTVANRGGSAVVALMMLRQSLQCLRQTDFPIDPIITIIDMESPALTDRMALMVLESQERIRKQRRKKKRKKKVVPT
jgi:hypothetical protein